MIKAIQREWLAIILLVLSPFAYLGAMRIERALPARTSSMAIDEAQAVRIAREIAQSRQVDTAGWDAIVGTHNDDKLTIVYRKLHPAALRDIVPPSLVRVQLQTPDASRWFRVSLTPGGKFAGFQESKPKHPVETDSAAARAMAESALQAWMGQYPDWHLESHERDSGDDSQDRTFTWSAAVPGLTKTTATFHIDVFGNRVIGERVGVSIGSGLLARINPGSGWLTFLQTLAWIYVLWVGAYSVVRYIRRSMEKEISHQRTLLAALGFVVISTLFAFDPGYLAAELGTDLGSQRTGMIVLMMVLYSLMGVFVGVAYGAGEGALREIYPGKLTSLDAFLSGRIFSTNFARSLLLGGAIAGWLLLAQKLVLLVFHASRAGSDQDIFNSAFFHLPLLQLLGNRAADAVLLTTFGLLLPIGLLRPRIRKAWIFFALMPLFGVLAATLLTGSEPLWVTFFAVQGVLLTALILSFYLGDLLTAMTCIFAVRFVGALIQRSAVSANWEHVFLWEVVPFGVTFLVLQVVFAWRGPTYEEFEVRPQYARYLAEHQSMEAEIGAARLAQLRLLPAAAPRIDGLSIAGACVPAREVGGDFFDFYAIDAHRLGVFLAEGGSRELGSAMPIALAKGYLLHASGLDLPPAEMLRRLTGVMGTALHGNASMSVLYAVIDARARTVRWARTGASPRLLINGAALAEEVATDRNTIRYGVASLALKDALFFYTDGLAHQIVERKHQWTDKFLQKLVRKWPAWRAEDLQNSVLRAALRGKQHPPDDVTSVVVRVEVPAAQTIGVVA